MKTMSDKLSRSKLDLMMECPLCFWMDQRLKIKRPSCYPLTINMAIDGMLKRQFDQCREQKKPHPVMEKFGIDAVPFQHIDIGRWRANASGIRWIDVDTDFLVFGAVDDVWVMKDGVLCICDYKATGANQCTVYDSYQRQLEVYAWLFRQNGFKVSSTGYWLFAQVKKLEGFDAGRLTFDLTIQKRTLDTGWIPDQLKKARKILNSEKPPESTRGCEHCEYLAAIKFSEVKNPPNPTV